MYKFTGEVYSSDGTYAVMREDGTDIANVSRVELFPDDVSEHGLIDNGSGYRSTDEEYQEIIDRIHAAVTGDVEALIRLIVKLEGGA